MSMGLLRTIRQLLQAQRDTDDRAGKDQLSGGRAGSTPAEGSRRTGAGASCHYHERVAADVSSDPRICTRQGCRCLGQWESNQD
jgi:hypothetical protein